MGCSGDALLAVVALIFPPLPVFIKRGVCSADSLINLALCMLGYFPGLIHAWYIIAKYPEDEYVYIDVESGPLTGDDDYHHHHHHHHRPAPAQQSARVERPRAPQQSSLQPPDQPQRQQSYGAVSDVDQGTTSQPGNDQLPSYNDVLMDNKIQSSK